MKRTVCFLMFALIFPFFGAPLTGRAQSKKLPVEKVLRLAEQQYAAYLKTHSDPTRFLRDTKADGTLGETGPSDWTSGFFPGCLWYLYRFTGQDSWKDSAQKWTQGLESQKNNRGTHDLGFMLYDSYGLGYAITRDPTYKAVLLQGAKSLSTRFHPEVGAIRSWDNPDFHYPVIIDNLMNLEFLFWATRVSGDSSFYKIAVTHAETDLKYRFRPDNSSYHVLDFDPATGTLLRKMTHQGYSDSSCWARGQAWGIYGYTVLYRETKDQRYLDRAIKTADYFIAQTDPIEDHIPYWDFQAPDIPNAPRDASAAAIAASGMIELSRYAGKKYLAKAEVLLASLCSDTYLAKPGTNNYFLLKHSTGHKPHNSEIDVPIIYADYYLLEALWRYTHGVDEGKGAAASSRVANDPGASPAANDASLPLAAIDPGQLWPDKDGHHIQAHGGGIIKVGKTWYWYGEQRSQGLDSNKRYVSCYSSQDLLHWKFQGNAVEMEDPEHLGSHWILERPKVYYNTSSKRFVLYFHLDDRSYKYARVGIAVSDRATGPFTFVRSFRPLDHESRDIGQFIDDDGTAYLVFEDRPFGFRIARLAPDYMSLDKEMCLIPKHMEGGAIVHYQGLYYSIGSALTGWKANPNKYATATSLEGPWSEFQDIAPPETNTYGSQSTMLLKVAGSKDTTIIFMGDIWKPRTQWESTYLWMPVTIGEGKLAVPPPKPWKIDVKTGKWEYANGTK